MRRERQDLAAAAAAAAAAAQLAGTRALFRARAADGGVEKGFLYAGMRSRDGKRCFTQVPESVAMGLPDSAPDPPEAGGVAMEPEPRAMFAPPGAAGLVTGALHGSVEAARRHNARRVREWPGRAWERLCTHPINKLDLAAAARELGWDPDDSSERGDRHYLHDVFYGPASQLIDHPMGATPPPPSQSPPTAEGVESGMHADKEGAVEGTAAGNMSMMDVGKALRERLRRRKERRRRRPQQPVIRKALGDLKWFLDEEDGLHAAKRFIPFGDEVVEMDRRKHPLWKGWCRCRHCEDLRKGKVAMTCRCQHCYNCGYWEKEESASDTSGSDEESLD